MLFNFLLLLSLSLYQNFDYSKFVGRFYIHVTKLQNIESHASDKWCFKNFLTNSLQFDFPTGGIHPVYSSYKLDFGSKENLTNQPAYVRNKVLRVRHNYFRRVFSKSVTPFSEIFSANKKILVLSFIYPNSKALKSSF